MPVASLMCGHWQLECGGPPRAAVTVDDSLSSAGIYAKDYAAWEVELFLTEISPLAP
jgi:hypothetical protein